MKTNATMSMMLPYLGYNEFNTGSIWANRKLVLSGLFIFFTLLSSAQTRLISGRVTSQIDGLGLPDVSIVIKGTSIGTATDSEGQYIIQTSTDEDILIFSFIGYKTQEIEVGTQFIINVSLQADFWKLSEIVITGTGVPVEKRKLSFAVETVQSKNIPIVPTASIDQALVGQIAGAQISSINGSPGSEVSILLRGINTINRGTQPMILMDGVQMGATLLSSIDPNTIEKVEVIQGAAAATIYGAQGANGVIQLFTKKGTPGKMKVDFSFGIATNEFLNNGGLRKARFHGFETNTNNEVVDPATKLPLIQDPATLLYDGNIGYDPFNPATTFNKPYDQNLKYIDHFKMFFKPSQTVNSRISLSGGSDKMDYAISVSKVRQESIFIGDGYNDRTNLSVNIGTEIVTRLWLRSITQLIHNRNTDNIYEKQDFIGLGGRSSNMYSLFNTLPFADFSKKDIDGNYGSDFGGGIAGGINQFNPFYENQYTSSLDKKNDILQNFKLTYAFSKFLELDLQYGLNYQDRNFRYEVQNQSLNQNSNLTNTWSQYNNFADNTGEITVFETGRTFHNLKASAFTRFDFDKDFGINLPLKSITQITYDYRNNQSTRYQSFALGMPLLPPLAVSLGNIFGIPEDYKEEFVTFGYLVNQRFEYGELAGISGGFRSDYSSAFGKASKPFTFPRTDGFFRISALNFWDNSGISKAVLDWKIRAAYGEAGVQPQPFDRYLTLSSKSLGGTSALYSNSDQSNPDLSVEVSREFEAGTDIFMNGLKGNILSNFQLSVSYWTRNTNNSIFWVDAPPTTGVGTKLENAVSLKSDGLQASLVATILNNSQCTWNLTANFSKQNSIVNSVQNGEKIIAGDRVINAEESVGEFYGWLMLKSVAQTNQKGEPFIDPSVQSEYEVASNGWVINKISKQPFITTDRHSLGNPNPKLMMTFINDFSYKNFITLSFQLDWIHGNKLYNNTKQWMYRDGIHADYEKPISINGETGAWSAFYRGVYEPTSWQKNYFVEDASFIRLRNVNVGINFARLVNVKSINKLQLILSGRNLWTKTKYTGMDPEVSSYAADWYGGTAPSLSRGIDDNSQPNLRSYQFTFVIGL